MSSRYRSCCGASFRLIQAKGLDHASVEGRVEGAQLQLFFFFAILVVIAVYPAAETLVTLTIKTYGSLRHRANLLAWDLGVGLGPCLQ